MMPMPATVSVDARQAVDQVLDDALRRRASDIHLEPAADGYEVRYRIDGLLHTVSRHDPAVGRSLIGRLMVLAQLLTYRLDVPQEGRIRVALPSAGRPIEMRLAVIPTTHGLRAAVRMPADLLQPRTLEALDLPLNVLDALRQFAAADSGMLILTGPAGSGKTTTIYALLQHLVQVSPGLSIITLEDPVERDLPGVTQIEISPFGELTYERSLRSILRQDPQVLMLGEIRDRDTASLAIQATLSGHRLICTLHASDAAGAVARLLEMQIEPYQITSAVFGVVSQRLLRRRSEEGYASRLPAAEFVRMDRQFRHAVLQHADADTLRDVCRQQPGFVSMADVAHAMVRQGVTDAAEVRRVLGVDPPVDLTADQQPGDRT
jgi:general secretion pathway protein E